MGLQGCTLSQAAVRKIIVLLAETDMTILEISDRMGCSRSAVASLNRRYQIRDYAGLRSKWTVRPASQKAG